MWPTIAILRGRYCFGDSGEFGGPRELMTADVARAQVDMLLCAVWRAAALRNRLFGGEPLLNLPVVRETVEYAWPRRG